MGPLRQIANEKFASSPPDKRVDLALQRLNDIDSKLAFVNPLNQPIASASADIIIRYVIAGKPPPGSSLTMGPTQIGFGAGTNALLMVINGGMTPTLNVGDGTGTLTTTCSALEEQESPYVGKPISSLQDAQYIQIDTGAIPKNSSILGGSARWVINGLVPLDFEIPAQPMDGYHILIRELSDGIKPLSSSPNKSGSPP